MVPPEAPAKKLLFWGPEIAKSEWVWKSFWAEIGTAKKAPRPSKFRIEKTTAVFGAPASLLGCENQTTKPPCGQTTMQVGPAECAKRLNPPPPWCIHGAKAYQTLSIVLSKKVSPWVRAFRRACVLQVVSDSSLRRFIFGVFSFFGASFFGF